MCMIQKIFLIFPLSKPGYDYIDKETSEGLAYDITRCPVYDYFKLFGEEEINFFRNSWCTLDYPFAEYLVKGGKFERTKVLSAGDDRCDMLWKVT